MLSNEKVQKIVKLADDVKYGTKTFMFNDFINILNINNDDDIIEFLHILEFLTNIPCEKKNYSKIACKSISAYIKKIRNHLISKEKNLKKIEAIKNIETTSFSTLKKNEERIEKLINKNSLIDGKINGEMDMLYKILIVTVYYNYIISDEEIKEQKTVFKSKIMYVREFNEEFEDVVLKLENIKKTPIIYDIVDEKKYGPIDQKLKDDILDIVEEKLDEEEVKIQEYDCKLLRNYRTLSTDSMRFTQSCPNIDTNNPSFFNTYFNPSVVCLNRNFQNELKNAYTTLEREEHSRVTLDRVFVNIRYMLGTFMEDKEGKQKLSEEENEKLMANEVLKEFIFNEKLKTFTDNNPNYSDITHWEFNKFLEYKEEKKNDNIEEFYAHMKAEKKKIM